MTDVAIDKIIVRTEANTWTLPVQKRSLSLGNDPRLALNVPHTEVAARAATIDNRGAAPMIVNHNPFAIYVGREKLEPGGCTVWKPEAVVQLTRSVSLEFTRDKGTASPTRESPAKSESGLLDNRQLVPIAVILACCVLGGSMLFAGGNDRTVAQSISLDDLKNNVRNMRALLPERAELYDQLGESLRAAHLTDRLWNRRNPQKVVDAYRRLFATEIVRRPSKAESDLATAIKRYGTQRVQQLWIQMDYR
jgi:hypothetical protein